MSKVPSEMRPIWTLSFSFLFIFNNFQILQFAENTKFYIFFTANKNTN